MLLLAQKVAKAAGMCKSGFVVYRTLKAKNNMLYLRTKVKYETPCLEAASTYYSVLRKTLPFELSQRVQHIFLNLVHRSRPFMTSRYFYNYKQQTIMLETPYESPIPPTYIDSTR